MQTWTPSDVVTIIAALSAFAVSIINALKNTKTSTRADDNQQRLDSLARHLQNHDQQITTLAMNMPAPGAGGPQTGAVSSLGNPTVDNGVPADLIAPQGTDAEEPQ